ncbi:MAG: CHASE2 domain-containing protein [Chthoniobacterales bacterium]
MRRPSPWLMLVVLALGILLAREPRFADAEEMFLGWMMRYSEAKGPAVPLTVVEIGADPLMTTPDAPPTQPGTAPINASGAAITPLEFALYLQSVLDFQPGVVAFENVLKWRERDKAQEQVFLDQAMRVPTLLLAAELGVSADPDAPWTEIGGFTQVTGRRGDLAPFPGIARQPNEDLRLISTAGFVNLPEEISSGLRVPLLFLLRGEVVPSFALQAIMLWQRATPAEVKIVLGSHITLPKGRQIPIRTDGTMLIHPNAARRARHLTLNELLLAAQQRETGKSAELADLKDQIVLARTPANPFSPPDVFAATIATIQGNQYLRRVSAIFDYALLVVIAVVAGFLRRVDRFDLLLGGIAATAAYCLVALGLLARWSLWVPGVLPLTAIWAAVFFALFFPRKPEATVGVPPPIF